MSQVSPFSSFRLEDFPSEREWIGTLFFPLNQVLNQVVQAVNGQIAFGANIPTFTKILAGTNLSLPQTFQKGTFVPTQMIISQAIKDGVAVAMVGAWSISGDTITVNKLFEVSETGNAAINTTSKYSITLTFN